MKPKATVDTITVTIGKHKLTLTLDEANALRETLNDVLGSKPTFYSTYIEKAIERPSLPVFPNPWIGPVCEPITKPLPTYPKVTYGPSSTL